MKSALRSTLLLVSLAVILPGAPGSAWSADCNSNGVVDAVEIDTGQSPDCNRNGRPDDCDRRVAFLEVTAATSRSLPPTAVTSLVAADFDGDGDTDVAVCTQYGEILLHPGAGDGRLYTPTSFSDVVTTYGWRELVSADLDLDEAPELILRGEGVDLRIFANTGGGQFAPPERVSFSQGFPMAVDTGDADGDGDVDLVVLLSKYISPGGTTGFLVVAAHEAGVFSQSAATATIPGEWLDMEAHDLDLDGDLDAVLAGSDGLSVLFNRGDGSFFDPVSVEGPEGCRELVVADLNGDGHADVAAADNRNNTIVYLNGGDGSFGPESYRHQRPWRSLLRDADIDGDGDVDLFTSSLSILYNKGRGTFYPEMSTGSVTTLSHVVAADLDGEGLPELVGLTWGSPPLLVIHSTELGPLTDLDCNRNGIPDDCDLASGASEDCNGNNLPDDCERDCNENGIPDDCDLKLGNSADENLNGVPDDCDLSSGFFPDCDSNGVIDTWEDCNSNGVPDGCEISSGAVGDCGQNGVPDECEPDCNQNGVPDDCDLADGSSADTNSNGVPDECEVSARFLLSFQAPDRVPGVPGSQARFQAQILVSGFDLTPEERGIEGWSLSILSERAKIVTVTMDGTAAGEVFSGGFHKTDLVDPSRLPPDAYGVVSATVLSFQEPVSFDVRDTPVDVLDLLLEVNIPSDGSCGSCRLEYFDGLQSGGQPVTNSVYSDGQHCSQISCEIDVDSRLDLEAKEIAVCPLSDCPNEAAQLCALPIFRRGDSNSDGTVDISDAIWEFLYLFLGGAPPRCLDAADSNDDELVDISDGIHILNDFFRYGTGLPYPGPFYCGPDPTDGALGCAEYPPCGSS